MPIDLPLLLRLTPYGMSLDPATHLTHGVRTLKGAVWGSVPLADLGTPTFVLRHPHGDHVAQFRHKLGDSHAHIVFIAPDLTAVYGESAWLHLLDAMVVAAGRRGALTLNAEIPETSAAFLALRQAGFAVYARQEIWKREPAPLPQDSGVSLRPSGDMDAFAAQSLYNSVIPKLVLQADSGPEMGRNGLIYEQDGRILAYLLVQEGRCGIYIKSCIHPDAFDAAAPIFAAALRRVPRAERLPVYCCVRRYQDWLRGSLSLLNFEAWAGQAVMVKHTAARIEQPVFKPVHALEGVARAHPPIVKIDRVSEEYLRQ